MAGDRASSKQNEVDNQNTTGNLSAPAHESVEKDFRGVSQNSIRSDESENLRNSETSSNDIEYDKPLIMMVSWQYTLISSIYEPIWLLQIKMELI